MSPTERPYDFVIYGATGFTGELVAHNLSDRMRTRSWAVAGRNQTKLQDMVKRLPKDLSVPDIILADAKEPESLRSMCEKTKVVITTVGPYALYGEPLLEACITAGTHYCDITGEPAFVSKSIEIYHERAKERGIRILHCCGFDSIPADLGTYFTLKKLRGNGIKLYGYVTVHGEFSGGTWASALNAMNEGKTPARLVPKGGLSRGPQMPGIHRALSTKSGWGLPMPVIDAQIVRRSAFIRGDYPRGFSYRQYLKTKSALKAAGISSSVGALVLGAQFKPIQKILEARKPSGVGPSAATREKSFFRVEFVGTNDAGETVRARVSGGDPGYDETSKMLGECASLLVFEEGEDHTGVLTPAAAFGDALVERLEARNIRFEYL